MRSCLGHRGWTRLSHSSYILGIYESIYFFCSVVTGYFYRMSKCLDKTLRIGFPSMTFQGLGFQTCQSKCLQLLSTQLSERCLKYLVSSASYGSLLGTSPVSWSPRSDTRQESHVPLNPSLEHQSPHTGSFGLSSLTVSETSLLLSIPTITIRM